MNRWKESANPSAPLAMPRISGKMLAIEGGAGRAAQESAAAAAVSSPVCRGASALRGGCLGRVPSFGKGPPVLQRPGASGEMSSARELRSEGRGEDFHSPPSCAPLQPLFSTVFALRKVPLLAQPPPAPREGAARLFQGASSSIDSGARSND